MATDQERSVAPQDLPLAREFRRELESRLGRSDFAVKLFGSRATGEGDPESELDLFVGLSWDDPEKKTKSVAFEIACELTLERGILVSVLVADRRFLEDHRGYSFLEAVGAEGICV